MESIGLSRKSVLVILLSSALAGVSLAGGVHGVPADQAASLGTVPLMQMPALDFDALAEEDAWREEDGLPDRFADAVSRVVSGSTTIHPDLPLIRRQIW